MKKKRIIIIILALIGIIILSFSISVKKEQKWITVYARAGGGTSSGGSSGGSSGETSGGTTSHSHSSYNGNNNSSKNPIITILRYIIFAIIAGFSGIMFRIKIIKAKIHSKRLMSLLDNKDEAWKYRNIQEQVEKAYFIIQNAWTEQNINKAIEYMDEKLYENFRSKLEWMEIRKQKNVLKKISLIDAIPIAINDNEDDSKDYIWYYIRGSMVDYTIDVDTQKIVAGSKLKTRFTEYWKFTRKDNGRWILFEILQEDESDKISLVN